VIKNENKVFFMTKEPYFLNFTLVEIAISITHKPYYLIFNHLHKSIIH